MTAMSKALVAYFSPTGTTKATAQKLAKAAKADLFEIQPKQPYTAADLNWHSSTSRSSVEMNDPASRPEIAHMIKNFDSYDAILIGFPIWWYQAPTIINSFLEGYHWSGKKIALFATSGGSGMGSTQKILAPSAPGAQFIGERCFGSGAHERDARKWIENLGF